MRKIIYSPRANRLVYLLEKATPQFWEALWEVEGKASPPSARDDIARVTRKYLPRGAKILEGGCGRGDKVQSLVHAGFQAVGIDFAENTVKQAKLDYPEIDIRKGDVRSIDVPDSSFDGYWSIGVIEHFWDGYDQILAEAGRVLKVGGVLFLTAPWFSPYRQRRARQGGFPTNDFATEPDAFYQFALERQEVSQRLILHGFEIVKWKGIASEISVKEDVVSFRRQIDWLLGSRGTIFKRIARRVLLDALNDYCGHSFLAVARRR